MWRPIGQDRIVESLQRSLAAGRIPHAYLFVGPKHVGKMTLTLDLAQALNCASEAKPCGSCEKCRRIRAGNHPDVQTIGLTETREDGDGPARKEISIEQIREMQRTINLNPYEGPYRIIIVDGAEHMSEEASSALLKTLEEPPGSTVLILLANEDQFLLPTILSRCRRYDLHPVPFKVIEQALVDRWSQPLERAELLARLSRGRVGWAVRAIESADMLGDRAEGLSRLIEVTGLGITERFEFAAELASGYGKNRSIVREQLEMWIEWWRDVLLVKNGCRAFVTNIDREAVLEDHAARCDLEQIRAAISVIRSGMRQLEQNANPRLVLDVLMLGIPSIPIEREAKHA